VTTVSLTGVVMGIISVLVGGGMVYFIENTLGDVFGWSFALLGLPMIIVGMLLFFLKLQIEENIENISNLKNLLTGTNVLQTLLGLMITFSFLRTLPVVAVITIGYTVYAIVKVQKAKKILKETT
jgi:O-antigen/teichoic acid export membrane protein